MLLRSNKHLEFDLTITNDNDTPPKVRDCVTVYVTTIRNYKLNFELKA
jgi:hypothetical protein